MVTPQRDPPFPLTWGLVCGGVVSDPAWGISSQLTSSREAPTCEALSETCDAEEIRCPTCAAGSGNAAST